ncbi:prepilin-type N-terminal cleavage/methylation domain-containing protein [Candidatus Roizmanbacteria bacterium]|nr:prepilin-type N-terminal cleavage/methylation domain-containing protein [Candidatus Roizmanbacteria bacterium]
MKISNSKRGFTLIELLIVIALLGALAVGLLAAVDPFEQLKKGRDTSNRNTAAEFYNALIRYYSQRTAFPWSASDDMIAAGAVPITQPNALTTFTLGGSADSVNKLGSAIVSSLAQAGELKADFYNLGGGTGNMAKINFFWPSSDKVVVCYQPESKAFRNESNTKYDISGGTSLGSACPNATSPNCYICFQ